MDTNTISGNCSTFNGGTTRSDFGSLGFSGGNGGSVESVNANASAAFPHMAGLCEMEQKISTPRNALEISKIG